MLNHDCNHHPGLAQTLEAVKLMAYWPGVMDGADGVRRHWELCAHCMEDEQGPARAGRGIDSRLRLAVVQMDHNVLTDEHAKMVGVLGCLTLVDVATRMRAFIPAVSQSAEETARLVVKHWIPYYGVPDMLVSDQHSGFASSVMEEVRRVLGIAEHVFSGVGLKGATAIVERAHVELQKTLTDGFSKGDINNLEDYWMYLSFAVQKSCHVRRAGCITPFELVTGQMAKTARSMTEVRSEGVEGIEEIGNDSGFLTQLSALVQDLSTYEFHVRDERARSNAMQRDKSERQMRGVDFNFGVGDIVAYAGGQYILAEVRGPPGEPISAVITSGNGVQRKVEYAKLSSPGAAVPVRKLPVRVPLEGEFIVWKDDGEVQGGVVEHCKGDVATVHVYQADGGGGKSWIPLWKWDDGEVTRTKRHLDGSVPYRGTVMTGELLVVGELTSTHRLTQATEVAMRSANLL